MTQNAGDRPMSDVLLPKPHIDALDLGALQFRVHPLEFLVGAALNPDVGEHADLDSDRSLGQLLWSENQSAVSPLCRTRPCIASSPSKRDGTLSEPSKPSTATRPTRAADFGPWPPPYRSARHSLLGSSPRTWNETSRGTAPCSVTPPFTAGEQIRPAAVGGHRPPRVSRGLRYFAVLGNLR